MQVKGLECATFSAYQPPPEKAHDHPTFFVFILPLNTNKPTI
jgi:hypothetical protein